MSEQEIDVKDIVFKTKEKLSVEGEINSIVLANVFTNMLSDFPDKHLWKSDFFDSKYNIIEEFAEERLNLPQRVIGSRDFKKFTEGWEIEKKKFLIEEHDKAMQRIKEKKIKEYTMDQERLVKEKWDIVSGILDTVKKANDPNAKEFYMVKIADRKLALDMIKTELGEPLKITEVQASGGRTLTDDQISEQLMQLSVQNPQAFEALSSLIDEPQTI
jgi:hypothetical protein